MFLYTWLYHSGIACISEHFEAPKFKAWVVNKYGRPFDILPIQKIEIDHLHLWEMKYYIYIGQGIEHHGEYLNLGSLKFMTFRC